MSKYSVTILSQYWNYRIEYIEWWKHHKCAWVIDEFGEKQPLVYIAGSPLSGANKCAYVGADGESCSVSVNTRYTEAKQRYEAYTIEEVVEKLCG